MKLLIFFHASIIPVSYGVIEAYIYLYLMIVEVYSIIHERVHWLDSLFLMMYKLSRLPIRKVPKTKVKDV
ncbi:hypothetical protein ES703_100817 [subsurface metagenome]